METLAYLHLALAYEDPNPSPNLRFKDTDLRAASSVAMGFIASGIVASTLAYADAAQATLYYGSRGSDVAKLQEALGNIAVDGIFGRETLARLKSYQAKKGLIVDGIAGPETLSTLGWSSSSKNSKGQNIEVESEQGKPEQYGRLQLINDTPYMAIVSLYKPGNEQPSRYGYIPPCSERTLLDTYSSSWKVSFNKHGKFLIGEKADKKDDIFEVKFSKLSKEDIPFCEFDDLKALKAKPVNFSQPSRFLEEIQSGISRGSVKNFEDVKPILNSFLEESEKKLNEAVERNKRTGDKEYVYKCAEDYTKLIDDALAFILSSNRNEINDYPKFLGRRIRIKYLREELELNNLNSLKKIWKDWLKDCEKFPKELVSLPNQQLPDIRFVLEKFGKIDQKATNVIQQYTAKVNNSKPINETVGNRLKDCEFGQNHYPIFVNFNIQSQRTLRSCKS